MAEAKHLHDELQILCQRYQAVLLSIDEQSLSVAVNGPPATEMIAALRFAGNRRILIEQWPQARMEQQLRSVNTVVEEPKAEHYAGADDHNHGEDTPAVHFINQTLRLAIRRRASDIHLEPLATSCRVRLRIDGVLQEIAAPPAELTARVAARLKIMGKLDIAERRLPQDGQFGITLDRRSYSLRIATLPVRHGEKVVLRILQTRQRELALDKLGLSDSDQTRFTQTLGLPQGLILVTGPTGSGKTVTLYSAIRWLNDACRNICSVEDPIEIPLAGINQTAVNLKADLSFSRVLRAMLRQDPDVIMIGEIRDAETAEIAVNAAQTGHLVMTTLHTNSALETLTRLNQLGIPGYQIAGALKLVIAQRLVRRLCPHCKTPAEPISRLPTSLWRGPLNNWQATGCNHCLSGYYDRTAIYELLVVTPALQQALADNAHDNQLAHLAHESGWRTLLTAGLSLVNEGVTSIAEVYRVVGVGLLDQETAI